MAKKHIAAASVLVVMLVSLGSVPVVAATGTQAQSTGKTAKDDTSKRVCRNLVLSGSRLSTRFCRSQADWERDAEKAQRDHLDSRLNHSSRDGANNVPK